HERRLNIRSTGLTLGGSIGKHAEQDRDVRSRAARLLLEQVRRLTHEALAPELHAELLIVVEAAREEVRLLKEGHEPQKLDGRNLRVHGVVAEELVHRLDHEEMEHAS